MVQIIPATSGQKEILAHLLELYSYDFSGFHELDLGDDGRFGYPDLPRYWVEPRRHPFLVWIEGKLAGFVLVNRDETTWDMAEFFVVRRYRRRGFGTEIAHQIWSRFPGPWQIRVMEQNAAAQLFWEHAIAQLAGESSNPIRVERGGRWWRVFSFESKSNSE